MSLTCKYINVGIFSLVYLIILNSILFNYRSYSNVNLNILFRGQSKECEGLRSLRFVPRRKKEILPPVERT